MISSLPPTNRTIQMMIFVVAVVVVMMEVFDGKSGGMDDVDDDCGEAIHSTY